MAPQDQLLDLQTRAKAMTPSGLLTMVAQRFPGRVALASSFGVEDQVLTDLLGRLAPPLPIFTLDTGRLPQETYDVLDATRKRYGIEIQVLFPNRTDVEELVGRSGVNSFYDSVESRKACCHARKVAPLRRKLGQLEAWITGLRREQAPTRQQVELVEWDETNGLFKINPLAGWTSEQVWEYIRLHHVPYNALHDRGYPSIGCAPCTRAVEPGQDIRAGRWWWETPEHKECGLHVVDGNLVRKEAPK